MRMRIKKNLNPKFKHDMWNTTNMDQVFHNFEHLTLLVSDNKNKNYDKNKQLQQDFHPP